MERTNCFRDFAKYVSLNVLGMIGLSCYILADTYFVSKGLGANGLTALNLAIPIYSFIHGSGLMFGMGGATKYGIAKSQNETKTANRIFTNTIFLALSFAVVFFILGLFFSGTIIQLLGADEAVFKMSKVYIQVILLFAPVFILNNVLLCFVRNDGAPQLSMLAMLGGSFSNIILDYVFMFLFDMGIFGAVLATGLAPVISMMILLPFFLHKKNHFHLMKEGNFSAELNASIFSSGLPSLITEMSSGIVMIVFNAIILRLQGNVGVAAYGVIANLSLVVISIYTGIAQGVQPLLSSYHGSGDSAKIKALLRYALTTVLLVSGIVYACVFFGASKIADMFNSEQNAFLQSIAVTGLKIYFIACVFAGFNILMSVYFTSTEYARPAHIISTLRGFLLIIPMAFLLSAIGGLTGVWCVFPATEVIVAGIGGVLYVISRKRIS
ncbi:MATE family efflux transporter [Anaerocolumna cellulosilytica]|uniref:Multidrug export protein MepA n=1 Tax=Anaerocolumna cellulosilytica TaxID=433286 RepID=A0A6S6R3G6_9FIRM|nr:MATE family efflux transporter [Anaerocolumna cellulosilytica]MBB5196026.1 putative MATE family efflux protein [Anaerocolumna cellulosilytica]BCJ93671.1 MATE family efflux transporter [Anaerocolumna cellulosilytica]